MNYSGVDALILWVTKLGEIYVLYDGIGLDVYASDWNHIYFSSWVGSKIYEIILYYLILL